MALEAFNIEIIDTIENSMPEVLEHTQLRAPVLIWNGEDDKYQNIFASHLSFNFLVDDAADAKFSHLFTSNESRYLVKLTDTTDELNPVVVWQGHLLPEQFSEPYKSGVFFVGFTATDGLGRLKGAILPDDFYQDTKSVISIIAKCLEYTNNSFDIYIAPAIQNAVEALKMDQVFLNCLSYIDPDDDEKFYAYDILEAILKSFGLKIFQWQSNWYIIGLNRFDASVIACEKYNAAGVYQSASNVTRTAHPVFFNGSGQITLSPSFKEVVTSWKNEYDQSILPEDIFYQPSQVPIYFTNNMAVKHWTENGNIEMQLAPKDTQQNYYELNPIEAYVNGVVTPVLAVDPWYLAINGNPSGTITSSDYIELSTPIYIDSFVTGENTLTLEIDFICFTWAELGDTFTNPSNGIPGDKSSPYDGLFDYELLLDGQTLVSNSSPFPDYGYFNFKLRSSEGRNIEGNLKLENIPISKEGYLQLRIYQPRNRYTGSFPEFNPQRTVYTNISLEFNTQQTEKISKIRNIETSLTKKVDVYHADDVKDFTNRQILIDPDFVWSGITIVTPAGYQAQNSFNFSAYTNGADSYNQKEVDLTAYNMITNHIDAVYIFRNSVYELIPETDFSLFTEDGRFFFRMLFTISTPILSSEDVFVYQAGSSVLETDTRYLRERWKRYGQTEEIRFLEALNKVYHDNVKSPRQKLDGQILGLIHPLNYLTFNFNGSKNYLPVSIVLDLTGGESEVTLIDQTTEDVTDYDVSQVFDITPPDTGVLNSVTEQ